MRLLPTRLHLLQLPVFLLESPRFHFSSQDLLHKGPLALFRGDPCAVVLGRALDYCPNLRVLRRGSFARLVLVVAVWIKDGAGFEELEISFELWREIGAGHVEPV